MIENEELINRNYDNKYTLIVAILFLALFSNIRYEASFAIIRLFDVLSILFFIYISKIQNNYQNKDNGMKVLLPFFIIHIILSYKLGAVYVGKEFLQMSIVLSFLYIIFKSRKMVNFEILLKYLLFVSLLAITCTILWHLYNGVNFGWKQLPDTRIAYTFFTLLFFIYFKIYNNEKSLKFFFYSIILLIILLISGERKAITIFIFLFSLNYFRGFGVKFLIILAFIYFILSISVSNISNVYVQNKINSMINIINIGNVNYEADAQNISENENWSNVTRSFSIIVSKEIFLKNPFFGIGTNKYLPYLNENYYYLPQPMKLGIHGEFQRVLAENGMIGLLLYLLIWVKSWYRLKVKFDNLIKLDLISSNKSQYLLYSIYISIIFYVGTEASSLRSFILIGLIAILPDLIETYLLKYKKKLKINK